MIKTSFSSCSRATSSQRFTDIMLTLIGTFAVARLANSPKPCGQNRPTRYLPHPLCFLTNGPNNALSFLLRQSPKLIHDARAKKTGLHKYDLNGARSAPGRACAAASHLERDETAHRAADRERTTQTIQRRCPYSGHDEHPARLAKLMET